MTLLETKGKARMVHELDATDSKCLTCFYLKTCQLDPNFDADKVDGCTDWKEDIKRESAVVV